MTPTAAPAPPPVEHITIDEAGAARVKGTRIKVALIAILHHQSGLSPQQIAAEYETITVADVYAALAYYEDNRARIDAEIEVGRRLAEEHHREWAKTPHAQKMKHLLEERQRQQGE
mgnify:CR=1 FL=1